MMVLGIIGLIVSVIGLWMMWRMAEFSMWVQNLGRRKEDDGRH